ncbi:hypothetical protein LFL96_07195 [Paraburkholderia sp. D15]|nr:hypothetical protein [Paraburkholderia sp. D15]WGS51280.1 hypothetical protein LFL96_07195 [Paraburkholderia sp. D15]
MALTMAPIRPMIDPIRPIDPIRSIKPFGPLATPLCRPATGAGV